MAGPYQPYRPVGAEGQPLPYPDDQYDGPAAYPGVYPGMLPPPVGYPKPRRSRTLWLSLLVLVLAGAAVAWLVVVIGVSGDLHDSLCRANRAGIAVE